MQRIKLWAVEIILILLGTFLMAVGLNCFLVPFKLSVGGVSSIATVLLYVFKIPLWVTNILLNALLLALGYRFLSRDAMVKTALGIVFLSLFLEVTDFLPKYSENLIAGAIVGGVFVGAAIGFVIKIEGSTGGSDLAAHIFHKIFPFISVVDFILIIDLIIISLSGVIFGSVTVACFSAVSLFITAKISDFICTSGNLAKSVYIMSGKCNQIAKEITENFMRGVTGFYSKGIYTGKDNTTLLTVVSPKELPGVIKRVKEIDNTAFVIITDAKEVLGEGFKKVQ